MNNYVLFILEGNCSEKDIIDSIKNVFFKKEEPLILCLPAEMNIYMLWQKLKEDDFNTSVFGILKETMPDNKDFEGVEEDDISQVYLFFDYDVHQGNLPLSEEKQPDEIVKEMLESFSDETTNGKLYISYPMSEALRDKTGNECRTITNCFVPQDDGDYKAATSPGALSGYKKWNYSDWEVAISVFCKRIKCLFQKQIDYRYFSGYINPESIFSKEKDIRTIAKIVFVLSAFPEFLIDYYGYNFAAHFFKEKGLTNCPHMQKALKEGEKYLKSLPAL